MNNQLPLDLDNGSLPLSHDEQRRLLGLESTIERGLDTFVAVGNALAEIRDQKLWRTAHNSFELYCEERWGFGQSQTYKLINAAKIHENLSRAGEILPTAIRHTEPLTSLEPDEQRQVWHEAIHSAPNGKITQAHVQQTVDDFKERQAEAPKSSILNFYSMLQWETLSQQEQQAALASPSDGKFNFTNDNVEWARWTWNPITGCLHNCPYCYARDIATHKYTHLPPDDRFSPTFYPGRLRFPANTKAPDLSQFSDPVDKIGYRNVFTCSMADLFGKWVPTPWIQAVLDTVAISPQWNFLFLTKFPIRMAEFSFPPNTWIGTTVDSQYAVQRAETAFTKIRNSGYQGVAWLSCEPMMEKLSFSSLAMFDWLVVGGASRSSQTPPFSPPFDWIVHLYSQAASLNLPIYMKTNLFQQNGSPTKLDNRIRQYPLLLTD